MDRDEQEEARDALLDDGDDDLEFHITFPSPMAKDEEDIIQADMIFVPREEPEPVVYLLGWAGAQDKHLSKYSKMYETTGCITIRYTAPAEYVFFNPEKIKPLARKLLDLIEEMSLENNPVFFHIFSNNGATVYQYMADCLRHDPHYRSLVTPNLRGHIFDSSPGRRTCGSFVRATTAVLGLVLNGGSEAGNELFVFDYILKEDDGFGQPQLFLYSKADDVIKAEDIEEVAQAREKAGCDVTLICYDESAHVQHFKMNPESYTSSVTSFIRKALRDNPKSSAASPAALPVASTNEG